MVTIKFPHKPGNPAEKACRVKATPVSPETQTPVELKVNAVNEQTTEALRLLRQGISEQDPVLVGQGASISADASQLVLSKPRLDEVKEFAGAVGAVGINVGHSGTIMGVLLDARNKRGASTFHKAKEAFPDAQEVYHFRLMGGAVKQVKE